MNVDVNVLPDSLKTVVPVITLVRGIEVMIALDDGMLSFSAAAGL